MTHRVTAPEILDSLPPDDPAAVAGRRDLRRINAIMGNHRWICRRMADCHGAGSILEIGAGDGSLARGICQEYPHLAARYHAIDLVPCPGNFPAGATWHEKNLWSPDAAALLAEASVIVCSLVLHHFTDEELRGLGSSIPRCVRFFACEPCRRPLHLWQGRLIFPFIHRVTRHDMIVSIRAGFRGGELAALLGLQTPPWSVSMEETFFGAGRMAALRSP